MRVVVLGIGNTLLSDEGFGVHAIEALEKRYQMAEGVEVVDGGTTGMELFGDLFDTMEQTGADMTNTFRLLSRVTPSSIEPVLDTLLDQVGQPGPGARPC